MHKTRLFVVRRIAMKIRVGLFGFGKTGKLVADEFIKDDNFNLVGC